jgi:hypothetical protein
VSNRISRRMFHKKQSQVPFRPQVADPAEPGRV